MRNEDVEIAMVQVVRETLNEVEIRDRLAAAVCPIVIAPLGIIRTAWR